MMNSYMRHWHRGARVVRRPFASGWVISLLAAQIRRLGGRP